jgi:hypothetical protein
MPTITEPAREVRIYGEYDVVVLGGGPAGIAAAVAAGRAGRSTLMIERYGFLGGMGTAAGVTNFCGLHANVHGEKRRVVHGIAGDLLDRIGHLGGLDEPHDVMGRIQAQAYDTSAYKIAADDLLLSSGVDILFHALAAGVHMQTAGSIGAIFVETKSGRQAVTAKIFIDCSGDGDLAAWAGAPFELGDGAGNMLYPSAMFRINAVDPARVDHSWTGLADRMAQAERTSNRRFPRKTPIVRPQKSGIEWRANMTQLARADGTAIDGTDAGDLSRGEIIGLPGSGALVSCKSQKPMTKARVELLSVARKDEWKNTVVDVKREIDMEVKDGEAACQFDLRTDESAYRIVVVDEHGFENIDPPRRGIKIVSEEPPTVALLPEQFLPEQFPGVGIAEDFEVEGVPIPLGGAIRIAYTATHPYGLGRATLQYRVNEGQWQPFPLAEAPETTQTGPFDPRRGAFVNIKPADQVQFHAVPSRDPERQLPRTDGGGRFDFQTRGLPDLKIGDRVEFFVEVANRDPNSPQVGRSETRLKTVVTVPQLVQWIDATLRQEDRIRQLEQKQRGVFQRK